MGWTETTAPYVFQPEHPAPSGSVNYANPSGNPRVVLEAIRLGGISVRGEEELSIDASCSGVPLLVLTDGDRRDFCLGMATALPREHWFYGAAFRFQPAHHLKPALSAAAAPHRRHGVADACFFPAPGDEGCDRNIAEVAAAATCFSWSPRKRPSRPRRGADFCPPGRQPRACRFCPDGPGK